MLIAGGGVAALEAALAYGRSRRGMSAWEVLAPEPQFWYRPLAVAEPFALGNVRRFELSELTSAVGATLSPGTLVGIDAPRRVAHTAPGGEVPYDILLVACGAAPVPVVEGALTFRSPANSGDVSRCSMSLSPVKFDVWRSSCRAEQSGLCPRTSSPS